jgi:phosphohistidine phosphatase SixA
MAKRAAGEGVNKSEEIRKLVKSGVKKPAEVQATLAERGIKVSRQMVSTIKSKMRARKSARRIGRRRAEANSSAPPTDLRTLARFIRGVHEVGGIAEARKILKELE